MAKLYFNYSVMNAGKSAHLLLVRHNYIENGDKVLLFTSVKDDRSGVGKVASRIGISAEAVAVSPEDDIFDIAQEMNAETPVTAVLVDEVQFMTPEQVYQMSEIVDSLGLPCLAWGLKNNFQGQLFSPAVETILALADEINLIKTVCHCGKRATMILKYNPDGSIVRNGEVVETGGESRYVSVCRAHWKEGNIGPRARKAVFDAGYGTRVVCQSCETVFPSIYGDPEQAGDCAAKLEGDKISGYFGSTIADACEFHFVRGVPEDAKQGVICDACIRGHLQEGRLLRVSSWFDNDPPRDRVPVSTDVDILEEVAKSVEERA
ncbi:thymidine kinase [Rhizobium laguerreae]|uniref:thymidine kinase n=1 Tax=Rhizobium laguerreae TaxID=1076926 RepID=UPI001C91769C|nr:thymidine kinase [Rhizobium laguerreae]MBY3150837.1 thymidine kinase [Rhizobium laguerreae]